MFQHLAKGGGLEAPRPYEKSSFLIKKTSASSDFSPTRAYLHIDFFTVQFIHCIKINKPITSLKKVD